MNVNDCRCGLQVRAPERGLAVRRLEGRRSTRLVSTDTDPEPQPSSHGEYENRIGRQNQTGGEIETVYGSEAGEDLTAVALPPWVHPVS